MGVNFNLKEKKRTYSTIRLIYRFKSQRMVFGTGINVPVKFWDTKKQRAKYTPAFPDATHVNLQLKNIEDTTLSIIRERQSKGLSVLPGAIKSELIIRLQPIETTEAISFFKFADQFIQDRSVNPEFSKGTITNYKKYLKHLKTFHKSYPFDFDSMDLAFFEKFKAYLLKKDLSTNYVSKIIESVKIFLNDAVEKEITKTVKFRSKKTKLKTQEVYDIYLSVKELKHLFTFDLSDEKRLSDTRDHFLIGAFTGQRISDFTLLIKENFRTIDGVVFIVDQAQKTGITAMIPAHPIVLSIMEKHNWDLPKPYVDQKFNQKIKVICHLAGLKEKVVFYEYKGGKRQKIILPKYQMVSSHTARRSFITNGLIAGLSETLIMKMTGIKKRETLNKYIKLTPLDAGALAAQNDFFK